MLYNVGRCRLCDERFLGSAVQGALIEGRERALRDRKPWELCACVMATGVTCTEVTSAAGWMLCVCVFYIHVQPLMTDQENKITTI